MAKPAAVGNVACCRTVVLTALVAKTHARRLLHTVGRTPRVATTTAVVTIVGTPNLTSLTMVPHNFNTGGTQGGGPAASSLTVFQSQHGVPPAPSSGTHTPGMRYRPTPNTNHTGRERGLSAPTDYLTAVHWNFPSRRYPLMGSTSDPGAGHGSPGADVATSPENHVRESLPDLAKTVRTLRP